MTLGGADPRVVADGIWHLSCLLVALAEATQGVAVVPRVRQAAPHHRQQREVAAFHVHESQREQHLVAPQGDFGQEDLEPQQRAGLLIGDLGALVHEAGDHPARVGPHDEVLAALTLERGPKDG
eukprot:2972200-Pyramimonas_sp.AAC.1